MGSAISTRLRLGQLEEAEKLAERYAEIFPGRFYIEVMFHDNPEDRALNESLVALSRKLGIPTVFTNDSHFTREEDALAHEALICLATKRTMAEGSFFRDAGEGFHLRSYPEMLQVLEVSGLPPESLSNTLVIADQIEDYDPVFSTAVKMPEIDVHDPDSVLEDESWGGLKAMFDGTVPEEYEEQLKYEIETITSLGYSSYFLIFADICTELRRKRIRYNTRGSGASSLVARALRIHFIDPIRNKLVFARFLNPSRASLPDFDLDVDANGRPYILEWVAERYGSDCVALLGTYGFLKARRAVDDANRVLGEAPAVATRLKAMIPANKFGRSFDLDWKYFADVDEDAEEASLADADFSNATERDVIDLATRIEGTIRSQGIHAAGVIITPEPVYELMPVRKSGGTGMWITSFHNQNKDPQIESLGYCKLDLLGLRNLGVISEVESLINGQLLNRQDSS